MQCPKCRLVEMQVQKIQNNKVYHKCKKCGAEIEKEIKEEEKTVQV